MTKAKFAERRYVPKVTLPKVALGRETHALVLRKRLRS